MIRMEAIPTTTDKPARFGPFTSAISAAALIGLAVNLIIIAIERF